MEAEGVDVLFLAPSADLEYLTGVERQIPNFGEASYAHGWVAGAFFRPGADPVFVFPRMFVAFDLREEPQGEVVVVNETDDGFAVFERVAQGLGSTGTVAIGDRVWAETVLNLGRILGFDRLRTGSTLVNELRRVKTPEELEAMGRAIRTVEQTMAAVAPLVVPGVTMAELVEAVEHELREAGSRTPSFTTHHLHRARRGRARLRHGDRAHADAGEHVGDVRLRRRRRRLLLGLRPHDLLRRAAGRLPRGLRDHARRAGGGPRRRLRRARPPPP